MSVNARILKLKLFILSRLGDDYNFESLHQSLDITAYRVNYLFNGRLTEFRFREIQKLADLLNVHPGVLVFGFDIGTRDLTFKEARALGLTVDPDQYTADIDGQIDAATKRQQVA